MATSGLLSQLELFVISRRIPEGYQLLNQILKGAGENIPRDIQQVPFCLNLAQWVDLGYRDLQLLHRHVDKLPLRCIEMSVADLVGIDLIHAYMNLAEERPSITIELIDRVLAFGQDLMPFNLRFLAHFWKGRACRKRGEYKDAMAHIQRARACAETAGALQLVAVAKIHESWLDFQGGDRRSAFQLLEEAEEVLRPTGHSLSLGNIASARGRFVRQSGDYQGALSHFEKAIAIYREALPGHSNLARALVNAAYVKRLMAISMQSKMCKGQANGKVNARYVQLLNEGLELLSQAREIYSHHQHQGGTGSVLVNAGFLHLQMGSFDKAVLEAKLAYSLGSEKGDLILMARAKNLQSTIERLMFGEQFESHDDLYASASIQHAEEAMELAKQTQNKRLLAEALLARGFASLDGLRPDFDIAKRCASEAAGLLNSDDRDHLYEELAQLRQKLLGAVGIDGTLRRWTEGQLADKSFQQVQEEFADFVIPRVWENCDRNITRVAKQLSISPKKVRRILLRTQRTKKT